MANKRLLLARCIIASKLHRLVTSQRAPLLLILNYHRIHAAAGGTSTAFDDGVFNADLNSFRRQMQWLKSATTVLDEGDILEAGLREKSPRGSILSAVTFDDAYIDCFTIAKPVLDELGIRGIFFVPIEMIESRQLGWWDLTAYMLKKTRARSVVIDGRTYDLRQAFAHSHRQIIDLFKLETAERTATLLTKISEASGVPLPSKDEQSAELMTWSQVRALKADGHAIGSHSLSHRVLATLTANEQAREIHQSRRELEALVGAQVASFAYPVGGPQHIDHHSVRLVREAGYAQAFTYNTGIASLPIADRFQIPRESARSLAVLESKAMLPSLMGVRGRVAVTDV